MAAPYVVPAMPSPDAIGALRLAATFTATACGLAVERRTRMRYNRGMPHTTTTGVHMFITSAIYTAIARMYDYTSGDDIIGYTFVHGTTYHDYDGSGSGDAYDLRFVCVLDTGTMYDVHDVRVWSLVIDNDNDNDAFIDDYYAVRTYGRTSYPTYGAAMTAAADAATAMRDAAS